MIKIEDIKRFVSNDFNGAILSGKIKENKIQLRLTLKDNTKIKYKTISSYSLDLKRINNNPEVLCNYLLDCYLENNTVIGIEYFAINQYHYDKNCFNIITTNGILTLAFSNDINLDDLFPKFVKRLENAKHEGIILILNELKSNDINHGYKKDELILDLYKKFKTGLNYYQNNYTLMNEDYSDKFYNVFAYDVLMISDGEKMYIPYYEKQFLKYFIEYLLDYTSSHCSLKHVIDNIDNIMTNVESNPYSFNDIKYLNLGNLLISYNFKNKKSLELIKQILIEINASKTYEKEEKQLILGGYYERINNGKISKFM